MRNVISDYKAKREQEKELNEKTMNNYQDIAILQNTRWQHNRWKNEYMKQKLGKGVHILQYMKNMFIKFAEQQNITNYAQILQNEKVSMLFKQFIQFYFFKLIIDRLFIESINLDNYFLFLKAPQKS